MLLTYRGQEPVNVAWFFACTIGIQWLILAVGLAIWALRRTTHLLENFHPIRRLLAGMLWSLSTVLHQFPGNQREKIRARLSGIRRRGEIFQLLVWPLLMITQIFGVLFNVGVLIALLLPLGRDVAFGWQSTLKTSPPGRLRSGVLDRRPVVLSTQRPSDARRSCPEPIFVQRGHRSAF